MSNFKKRYPRDKRGALARAARERIGFTQKQLADRFGLTTNTIARRERGEIDVTIETLYALEALWAGLVPPTEPPTPQSQKYESATPTIGVCDDF
jgi:transcriptional regulator with XRE-family HTH domain